MKNKGFTLLELLVVISIIGLLASMFVFGYSGWTERAKLANAKSFSQSVRSSLGAYPSAVWTFDNLQGVTVYDDSGNNNNGTIYNGATQVDGIFEKGLEFDGADDYVGVSNSNTLNPDYITIAAWVYPTAYQSYANVVTKRYPAQYILRFYSYGGRIQGYIYGGGAWRACTTATNITAPLNKWSHLLFTYDGQQGRVYINGTLGCSFDYTGKIDSGNSGLRIGTYSTGATTNERFKGIIDDVRIYREPFAVAQVKQLYAQGLQKRLTLK